MPLRKTIQQIKQIISERLRLTALTGKRHPRKSASTIATGIPQSQSEEEKSRAELGRLQKLIEDRKQIARDTDISYHLWDFYKSHFRESDAQSLDRLLQDGEWYDVKILNTRTDNGLNKFEFRLKGARYQFVDDEENQGWGDKVKYFSLFLYEGTDKCLIEIPMKVKIDKWGRKYSVLSDGPKAFLPGGWINDFINVKLKHQRIRNQEIRDQKHQERLWEIEDLKDRFGISD